jgi:hypothetical protein
VSDTEKGLLMALESDAKAMVRELENVLICNPLIYVSMQENTEIIHRMVMIKAKLSKLETERQVQTDKDSISDIIQDNFDNYGILDSDDEEDNSTRRDLIASILYDLEKVGFAFVRVKRTDFVEEGPVLPDGGVTD